MPDGTSRPFGPSFIGQKPSSRRASAGHGNALLHHERERGGKRGGDAARHDAGSADRVRAPDPADRETRPSYPLELSTHPRSEKRRGLPGPATIPDGTHFYCIGPTARRKVLDRHTRGRCSTRVRPALVGGGSETVKPFGRECRADLRDMELVRSDDMWFALIVARLSDGLVPFQHTTSPANGLAI